MNAPKIKSRGFSLVEILLVLGIIAILAIAAFILYPQVSRSMRINQEIAFANAATAHVRSIFQGGRYGAVQTYYLQQREAGAQ